MPDNSANFGTTLSDGIQDISALLPLLGTEQVERHVGSSLEKGYLYAAASTLSLFGSLGGAKAGFATFIGTIAHPRFYGGRWFDDAGFGTAGSITSMVTIDKDTGLYGAELKLKKLMEEQHIDDPNLVSGFEWSGWKRAQSKRDAAELLRQWNERSWRDGGKPFWGAECCFRVKAILSSATCMHYMPPATHPDSNYNRNIQTTGLPTQSGRPALQFMESATSFNLCALYNGQHNPLHLPCQRSLEHSFVMDLPSTSFMWLVPMRSLQLRIHRITSTSLAWMKVRRKNGDVLEETHGQKMQPLEQRIRDYLQPWQSNPSASAEEGRVDMKENESEVRKLGEMLAIDPMLVAYQVLIAIGMVMIVAGYVGCFSIVKNSDAQPGLTCVLWGANPSWDESTGLTMNLELHKSDDPYYPLITSPHSSEELGFGEKPSSDPKPFVVYTEGEFFAAATSWIGPVQRLGANAITLYYAILTQRAPSTSNDGANTISKDLSVTILLTDSRSFTFLCHGNDGLPITVFLSKLLMQSGIGSPHYQVLLGDQTEPGNDGFLRSRLFYDVLGHAQTLRARMFRDSRNSMDLKWNLFSSHGNRTPPTPVNSGSLSSHDRQYVALLKWRDFVSEYIDNRRSKDPSLIPTDATEQDRFRYESYTEMLTVFECAILEVYIWHAEWVYLDRRPREWNAKVLSHLHSECHSAMVARTTAQKNRALSRWHNSSATSQSERTFIRPEDVWTHLIDALQKLRDPGSDLRQTVQRHYDKISALGFEQADLMVELGADLLPPSFYSLFISDTACPNSKSIREECLYHLCLAVEYIPNTPPPPSGTSPYVSVNRATEIPLLQRKNTLRALDISLNGMNKKTLREYLALIFNLQDTAQMTTLVLRYFNRNSTELKTALTEVITRHPNILCLAGTGCHRPGEECEELHCKAIAANREVWKKSVNIGSGFVYWVGFEARDNWDVQARGNHVKLLDTGRCIIEFHCPGPGELNVTLSVRNMYSSNPIELMGTLSSDLDEMTTSMTREVSGQRNVVFGSPMCRKGSEG
ncbi:hypothetical protein VNI00_012592 [Paramarasmius palmivorus]|uniref:Uncharacterized protein n=1 Tax=Paramarasmius palmivorus TaxID=297713 RepID=A0AAW0C8F1_9AGAR